MFPLTVHQVLHGTVGGIIKSQILRNLRRTVTGCHAKVIFWLPNPCLAAHRKAVARRLFLVNVLVVNQVFVCLGGKMKGEEFT